MLPSPGSGGRWIGAPSATSRPAPAGWHNLDLGGGRRVGGPRGVLGRGGTGGRLHRSQSCRIQILCSTGEAAGPPVCAAPNRVRVSKSLAARAFANAGILSVTEVSQGNVAISKTVEKLPDTHLFGILKKTKTHTLSENFLNEFATSVSGCVLHQMSTVNDSLVFLRLYVSLNAHPPLKLLVLQL